MQSCIAGMLLQTTTQAANQHAACMLAWQELTGQASCQHAYLLCDAEAAGHAGGVYEGIWHL